MVTLRVMIIAIALACLLACALMLTRMLIASPRRPWHRHLDKGSLAMGLFMIIMGFGEYTFTRRAESTHTLRYYKEAPMTPFQGYAAAVGLVVLGAATTLIAIVHGRDVSDESPRPPAI
jgi:uncharacterized membrane protein